MSIVLAADMHLQPGVNTAQNNRLKEFLAGCLEYGELILVGDTFNCWFEKNGRFAGDYQEVVDIFSEATGRGLRINLLCGNRDFVLSGGIPEENADFYEGFLLPAAEKPSVLAQAGIRLHGWVYRFEQDGVRYHCSHGDVYCIDNVWHQLLRYLLMGNPARISTNLFPVWFVDLLFRISGAYHRNTGINRHDIYEYLIMQDEALLPVFASGVDRIICGHLHQYMTRNISCRGTEGVLTVLPCWAGGEFALLEDNRLSIKNSSFG